MEAARDSLEQHTVTMHSNDHGLFLAGFHPDTSKEMRDKAHQSFHEALTLLVLDNDLSQTDQCHKSTGCCPNQSILA